MEQTHKYQAEVIDSKSDLSPVFFQNPWPHLESYFMLNHQSKENNKVIYFQCQKCLPAKKIINGHVSSLHNLKSHFRRTHPTFFAQFVEAIKAGSNRGKRHSSCSNSIHNSSTTATKTLAKKIWQPTIVKTFSLASSHTKVSQSTVDEKIIRLFINNVLPFHVVESKEFVDLIRTLNPTKISMSCHTLGRQIDDQHLAIEESITNTFDGLMYLATTADCWTAHNRSFLGITAHWIDQTTGARKHAVLSCTRLIGHHLHDIITKEIIKVHEHFNIQEKVVRITTDNGSNFVKAFTHYGGKLELFQDPSVHSKLAEIEPSNNKEDRTEGDDDYSINIVALGELFDKENEKHRSLPVYMRCAAHTFNLVATVDLYKNLLNQEGPEVAAFNKLDKKAHDKAQILFIALERNPQIGDAIEKAADKRLVIPDKTKWNTLYDSIIVLNSILAVTKTKVELNKLLASSEKLVPFTDLEITYLKEWANVMSRVAIALDTIQGERNAYLGTLLPIVAITITTLKEMRRSLTICKPLADALVEAISTRFNHYLCDEDFLLAAAFHPKFRLHWLRKFNINLVTSVKVAMEVEVERELKDPDVDNTTSSVDGNMLGDIFFGWIAGGSHATVREKANRLVETWVNADGKDGLAVTDFMGEKAFMNLFQKFNTPIPSSAAVEKFFSSDNGILGPKGATLETMVKFEKLIFLKGNQHIVL